VLNLIKIDVLFDSYIYIFDNLDILTKINRTTLDTWYEIKGLVERIESLENALLNNGFKEAFNNDLDNNFIFALPLSIEEELEVFEQKLLDT